jgi:hypothetical protein
MCFGSGGFRTYPNSGGLGVEDNPNLSVQPSVSAPIADAGLGATSPPKAALPPITATPLPPTPPVAPAPPPTPVRPTPPGITPMMQSILGIKAPAKANPVGVINPRMFSPTMSQSL